MKKILILLTICLLFNAGGLSAIFAQEAGNSEDTAGDDLYLDDSWEFDDDVNLEKFWIQDRGFELGLLQFKRFRVMNNFISLGEIFTKEIVIDLDKLPDVMRFRMDFDYNPFYFTYDSKEGWGFGVSQDLQVTGFFGLNSGLPVITDGKKTSEIGGAAFANVSPSAFFNLFNFKVGVKSTFFMPLFYAKGNFSYNLNGTAGYADFKYDFKYYLPVDDNSNFNSSLGYDLSLSAEYKLSSELGLENIHPLLNFDVGASLNSIPIIPGNMKGYERMWGEYVIARNDGTRLPKDDEKREDEFINSETSETQSFSGKQNIYRPFSMHVWADWRPLGTELITVTPLLGFAVNPLYLNPGSFEGGITGHLNLSNLFHVKLGINYLDRLWTNSLDLILNFRAVEFSLGLSLCSQDFVRSWNGSGFGISLGFICGW